MKVSALMRNDVEVIDADKSVYDAARKMKELNIGSIPVRHGDRLAGMLTDRDIVLKGVAEDKNLKEIKVESCMTSPIVYAFDDQEADEAAKIMQEKQIRRLPILNRSKRLVGILTLTDIGSKGDDDGLAGKVLKKVTGSHDITASGSH